MSHYKKVCEYGKVHTQCRCPGPKTTITVTCDRPNAHKPYEPPKPTQVSMPFEPASFDLPVEDEDSLPSRLDTLLERRLWWMKTSERLSLLSDLMEEINRT